MEKKESYQVRSYLTQLDFNTEEACHVVLTEQKVGDSEQVYLGDTVMSWENQFSLSFSSTLLATSLRRLGGDGRCSAGDCKQGGQSPMEEESMLPVCPLKGKKAFPDSPARPPSVTSKENGITTIGFDRVIKIHSGAKNSVTFYQHRVPWSSLAKKKEMADGQVIPL